MTNMIFRNNVILVHIEESKIMMGGSLQLEPPQ